MFKQQFPYLPPTYSLKRWILSRFGALLSMKESAHLHFFFIFPNLENKRDFSWLHLFLRRSHLWQFGLKIIPL